MDLSVGHVHRPEEEGVDALQEAAAQLLRLADIEEKAMTALSALPSGGR